MGNASVEVIKKKIKDFIQTNLTEAGYDIQVEDNTSLILSGLVESLVVVRLVFFIENEFGIDFSATHFDQQTFDTINGISRFIEERC